jgi:hypothetical protein
MKQKVVILTVVVVAILAAFLLFRFAKHNLAIDDCLDHGGVWDDITNSCQGMRTEPETKKMLEQLNQKKRK